MSTLLLVSFASALGAPARYLLDRFIQSRHERVLPWGTWTVNVTGALLLGLLVGLAREHAVSEAFVTALGAGFLGSYTTFSTFTWETVRLVEDGAYLGATLNVVLTLVVGLGAAVVGAVIPTLW
ncbi:MAG: fluoride efflux transporter CrcB [Actinomycetota bacterium]|nr:fluoride efflux transporter CrcB [Actinomycetota bacterium]